jgi:hypothetical protein
MYLGHRLDHYWENLGCHPAWVVASPVDLDFPVYFLAQFPVWCLGYPLADHQVVFLGYPLALAPVLAPALDCLGQGLGFLDWESLGQESLEHLAYQEIPGHLAYQEIPGHLAYQEPH